MGSEGRLDLLYAFHTSYCNYIKLICVCLASDSLVLCSIIWYHIAIFQALLHYIASIDAPGSVLVFLPGWNLIFAIHRYLTQDPIFGKTEQFFSLFIEEKFSQIRKYWWGISLWSSSTPQRFKHVDRQRSIVPLCRVCLMLCFQR